jgi:hypothetical protein
LFKYNDKQGVIYSINVWYVKTLKMHIMPKVKLNIIPLFIINPIIPLNIYTVDNLFILMQ